MEASTITVSDHNEMVPMARDETTSQFAYSNSGKYWLEEIIMRANISNRIHTADDSNI